MKWREVQRLETREITLKNILLEKNNNKKMKKTEPIVKSSFHSPHIKEVLSYLGLYLLFICV